MFRQRAQTTLCLGLFTLGSAYMIACGSGGTKTNPGSAGGTGKAGAGNTAGTGNVGTSGAPNTGSGGAPATGGTGGTGGSAPAATACLAPVATGAITDFTVADAGAAPDMVNFGDATTVFSGGTYIYPNGTAAFPLTSDVTMGNWHITGTVGDFSGLGLFFQGGCAKLDASAFTGIRFTIQSNTPDPVTLTLNIGTAGDQIAADWLNDPVRNTAPQPTPAPPSFGRCIPASTNKYDGTCGDPIFAIPLTLSTTPTTVAVTWAQLVGHPGPLVPSEITGISWYFAWTAGQATYPIDIVIDDLAFTP